MTSLFVEQHPDGIAFYINGDLQFDTADEAIYHEYLVIPAIALAVKRFPDTDLRVLICGGGDGLAAREVLRFPQVTYIDLVDYNPEVLELGKTVFKPYNGGSLESDILTVYVQDAFEFLAQVPTSSYQVVICDFTYPTSQEDTKIYSKEWFQQVNLVLELGGILSSNGVSPENRTSGFWCLYQTLLAAELIAKPLQLSIPSFRRLGYGNWGFFLASQMSIQRGELEEIVLPENLHLLRYDRLLSAFVFDSAIANIRHNVAIHTWKCPQLFYYLLNPDPISGTDEGTKVDFLDVQELGNGKIGTRDWLQLESTAKAWIEQIYSSQDLGKNPPDISKLLPIQHRYHSAKMRAEWLVYLKQLLAEIDFSRLINSLLERAQELPPQISSDLRNLSEKIRSGQSLSNLSPSTTNFLMMLSVTLLMANLITPDAVFAKAYYSSGTYSSSNDDTPIILTPQQSTGLQLMGWGAGLLVILALTFVDWSGSNDD